MDNIRDLIAQNRIKEALNELAKKPMSSATKIGIDLLINNFSDLEYQLNLGLIPRDQGNREKNQIIYATFGLMQQIEKELASSQAAQKQSPEEMMAMTPSDPANIESSRRSIFISYAWGDKNEEGESREKIVDKLCDALVAGGYEVIRDKKSMTYGDSIRTFMEKLGEGELILVFISDKYLRSPNSMFELYEIFRTSQANQEKFSQRVLPIMVEFIKLDRPSVIESYLDHWEEEEREWKTFMKKRFEKGQQINRGQTRRLHIAQNIYANFGDMADWLIDINAMTNQLLSQNDFQIVKEAIHQRLSEA